MHPDSQASFPVAGTVTLRQNPASLLQQRAEPAVRRRMKRMLWTATALAILFATLPSWQGLLIR